ncbi:MAG: DUF2344 domain-containing protein [Synergistaceae bacterium]|nr:DUF2344 domain-containing protein [Synergistaceae bacterium]MBQ6111773.1 DUF2344 domain-containing protein [Synergistaceae bacterium]MBQ9629678.1 DUF2344 domain-containing protein [Synergistaceae bacterium]MBR0251013.1 DUF2344 domain-containing protein [Synergistaceae bacterium]
MRARLIYSKRGGACFVPHIALAQIFSRSAMRSGLRLIMTQGFSPRAKISFAPELPAGVVALNEPVDMYFDDDVHDDIALLMNESLPEGFHVSRVLFPDDNSPSLGKMCKYAEYLIRTTTGRDLNERVKEFYGSSVLRAKHKDTWLSVIISEPAQNPIGGLVKHLKAENIIAGWHEMNIVRVSIGGYDTEGDCVCLK